MHMIGRESPESGRDQTEGHTTKREWKQWEWKRGGLKQWMQALGLLYILLFLPITDYFEEVCSELTGKESRQAAEETVRESSAEEVTDGNIPGPMIALTFDDGPNAESTPVLLDGLKERGVHATFFVIGENIEKEDNCNIIRRMQEEGHEIGNHTYHHVDLSKLSYEDAHRELVMTDELIRDITGKETSLVRPPFGAFPAALAEEIDKIYVKWTVDPLDWTTENVDEIVQKVVTDVQENDIILLHDCYNSSVEAAFQIIDILQAEGYEFVTADRLLIE